MTRLRHILSHLQGASPAGETLFTPGRPAYPYRLAALQHASIVFRSSRPCSSRIARPGLTVTLMSKTSLDKSKIKFLLLEGIHPSAVEVLRGAGYSSVETLAGALPEEELRKRIIVLAIAPGAYIDDKYAHKVTHYRSTRDIVPLFDFVGAFRCRESTVVLKPHPDAPWFDHSIDSPTYQKAIREHVTFYREQCGGITCAQSE